MDEYRAGAECLAQVYHTYHAECHAHCRQRANIDYHRHLESGRTLITEPEIIKKEYDKLVAEFIDRYKTEFHKADIDYSYFNTSVPLDQALTEYLSRRAKL